MPPKPKSPSKLGLPVTELSFELRTRADVAKVARVRALKGSVTVATDCQLDTVDVGELVEVTRYSLLNFGHTKGVAHKLAWAGQVSGENVDLPALRYAWYGHFSLPVANPVLELPTLEETLDLTISTDAILNARFTVRLPKLAKGKVRFHAHAMDPDETLADSVFEMPLLPPENLTIGGHPDIIERIEALVRKSRRHAAR